MILNIWLVLQSVAVIESLLSCRNYLSVLCGSDVDISIQISELILQIIILKIISELKLFKENHERTRCATDADDLLLYSKQAQSSLLALEYLFLK